MANRPLTAFINPEGHNREEVRTLLYEAVDLVVEAMADATSRSPLPDMLTTDRLQDWATVPDSSVGWDVLKGRLRSQLQAAMNAAHPSYIGHMDSIPTTVSIVGDMVAAALNNNMLSVEMSPLFSRLEPLVLDQLTTAFGLGPEAGGLLVSGGSLANLQALTVARNVAFDAVQQGIVGRQLKPVFLASKVAHTSVKKAAMLMGLGTDAVIPVATNANSQMDAADLMAKIEQAKQFGQTPFAVMATAGTTVTGNLDPIAEIAEIAKTQGLWFHVDAAYGGAVIFSERYRSLLAGIEQADSITFNPQKWLYVSKTCATVLFRQFDILKQQFQILAPYMNDHDQWSNLGEFTVQGTRHADIVKLWLSLQHLGKQGYSDIIDHNFALADYFTQQVAQRSFLTLASQPQMNLVCFRGEPDWLPAAQWDTWNAELQQLLLTQGNTFISLPIYRGQRWLKAVLLNPFTQQSHLNQLFEVLDTFANSHQR